MYEDLGLKFRPTSYLTLEEITEAPSGVAKLWTIDSLSESYEDMTAAMNLMVYVLMIAAVVVLYNLGVLSFTEMELSTLKVIGFKSRKIRRLLLTQNIWLTAVGIIIGIPVGKILLSYIISYLGDSVDFITVVTPLTMVYSIIITFTLSILVNLMFSRKVKKIDMVSSLKGVE